MNILALDCSTEYASIAISGCGVLISKTWRTERRHTRELAPAIAAALTDTGLSTAQLDAIAVGIGPGSYTGIRVALAFAKGLALAADRPLVGISTLEVLAYGCAAWTGPICAAIASGPSYIGMAIFQGPWSAWQRLSDDCALSIAAAAQRLPAGTLLCGPAADLIMPARGAERAPTEYDVPHAHYLAALGLQYFQDGGEDQVHTVQPHYLRPSSAEERLAVSTMRQ
jgi:tRNA threonylcarbamoyladenosine biosynthesis protein TsaB